MVLRLEQNDELKTVHPDRLQITDLDSITKDEEKKGTSNSIFLSKENDKENIDTVNKPILKRKLLGLGKNTFGLSNSLLEEDTVEKEVEWI